MQDVMIDLETLGTVPGCTILSIGAVAFDEFDVAEDNGFYVVISTKSCEEAGLCQDQDTLDWWTQQSPEARKVLDEAGRVGAVSLCTALGMFDAWLRKLDSPRIWGNGADFDNPIVTVAARAVKHQPLWKPYNGRCYRTVKSAHRDVKMPPRTGTHHNALSDAINQARHLVQICSTRGWRLA
jgi:hypothetical protein